MIQNTPAHLNLVATHYLSYAILMRSFLFDNAALDLRYGGMLSDQLIATAEYAIYGILKAVDISTIGQE